MVGLAAQIGVRIVLGSDAGSHPARWGEPATEMRLPSQAGLPPTEPLRAAIGTAAAFLGTGRQLGTIARGKQVDCSAGERRPAEERAAWRLAPLGGAGRRGGVT